MLGFSSFYIFGCESSAFPPIFAPFAGEKFVNFNFQKSTTTLTHVSILMQVLPKINPTAGDVKKL
jgi:hypothetical protein